MNFREVSSAVSGVNDIQLFTLGTDANLFHFQPSVGTGTGYTHAMVIQRDVALMGVTDQNAGNIEVFAVGTTQATLSHLIRQRESGNWQIAPLEVPTSGQVEEFISFSTDLMVYDAAGSPMPNAAIQVWASSKTEIMVNGGAYVVDAHTPANLRCAASGALSITQGTGILGIPTLQINVVSAMPSGQSIAVAQFAGVQERLANVTGPDLMAATTVGGQPLLGDAYRTPEQTSSLASAFNKCMVLTTTPAVPHATELFKNRAGLKRGVGMVPSNRTSDLNRILAPASPMHWQLDFSTGKVVYRDLSTENATHLLLEKRATHLASSQSVGGFLDWIGSIGDFVQGSAEGIISIVDTVITTVGNVVNAVFTFIVDGVTYLYQTVVQFIDQAFDLVEAFFAQVKVIFQKIFEWLGFIFSWPDILRTHDALAYTMNQFLGFLPLATAGLQQLFDQAITSVQSQMNAIFDQLVADVGGTSSLGGYTNTQTPDAPLYSSSNANNIVLNGTLENAKTATQTTAVVTPNSSPFDILIQQMQQLATSVENDPAFADALNYMTNLGDSADQMFSQFLTALIRVVQGLANAMIAGVKAIVDGFLQLVQNFITRLQSLFNAEWNIPFVS